MPKSQFWLSIFVVGAMAGCTSPVPPAASTGAASGGVLTATFRSEPTSYNRLLTARAADEVLRLLTHDTLVRVNRTTGALEPRLAESWTTPADGLRWTLRLRQGVRFSDGAAFTSADVAFTLRALYDPRVASVMADNFRIDGRPIAAEPIDAGTIALVFPSPHGRGIELLSTLPILPRHKLEAALDSGGFQEAWSLRTPLADVVGLGPFTLTEHRPGERLRFARNANFWNTADGARLPYLDGIDLSIVAEQNAEMLRLESGQADLTNDAVRAEDIAALESLAARGQVTLVEAGVGVDPDGLWFNLTPGAPATKTRPWLGQENFRRAVSLAVSRDDMINTVYLGQAVPVGGPVTPGHRDWFVPDLVGRHDPAEARALLRSIGLTDRNGDGMLDDAAGRPVRFTIVTHKGNSVRERSASVIRSQLQAVGIAAEVDAVDQGTIIDRYQRRAFDAIYFGFGSNTIDPTGSAAFWMSSGGFHAWNPGQSRPGTAWEAEIDSLMQRQAASLDQAERQRVFAEVQRIFADHLPAVYFVARKTTLATSARLRGVAPSVLPPPVLWNAEHLFLQAPAPGAVRR